jgi:hypothetical protein
VRFGLIGALCTCLLLAGMGAYSAQAQGGTHSQERSAGNHDNENGDEHHKQDDPVIPLPVMCSLNVPANPLTAAGLATPYQLGRGCSEANPDQSAFVEATVYDPATQALSVYRPLVINQGSTPGAPPVLPVLPANALVGIWFGFQGDVLTLTGRGAGSCTNGLGRSLFGQFAYCGARTFFAKIGPVATPPLGTARDGQPCPTVRDFSVVDQDQSDNVSTTYRVLANGRIAQNTAANAALGGTVLLNGSDNGLLNRKINPALGCASFLAPDLADPGSMIPSLALNELHAAARQAAPVALIPPNDPMTLVDGERSNDKTKLYRLAVGQPTGSLQGAAKAYCTNLKAIARPRIELDKPFTSVSTSPDPGVNLHDFLAARLKASLTGLGCSK